MGCGTSDLNSAGQLPIKSKEVLFSAFVCLDYLFRTNRLLECLAGW